jgi:putative membrane-bound dehydrogenase-like protein
MKNQFPFVVLITLLCCGTAVAQERVVIPHHQDKPPGPALSPEEAVAKMTVPEGFKVEIVAAEPDIVNPIAMTIDEKGRFWITESLEYPRNAPGPGKDRVKVLEDTDGDGKADSFKVFLDGLNIPSGVAVGFGGVWIANSPDILFVPDADRDAVPDGPAQVVVTGFGRRDTHELPNSLTWGPDGWLYGLNGIFNPAHVRYPKSNPNYEEGHDGFPFDAAMFRIHPRTREFQVFARGVSNPWGIAFNEDGEAFISACVIDHLWHITETGYYRRQAGTYPPFTWPIESIVDHKHQKAAYCGIHYFDSDAYPEKYRRRLYMGNIHGNCINVDRLTRNGSTYKGHGEPDFLSANDAWFMPVVQKTGPDGSLYILDWYDRYHCYQDARRDPKGIDRLKGRLYRVRYKDTPRKWGYDLAEKTEQELIEVLGTPNDYTRWTAQRLLQERRSIQTFYELLETAVDVNQPKLKRMHAVFAASANTDLAPEKFGISGDTAWDDFRGQVNMPEMHAWFTRAMGNEWDRVSSVPSESSRELLQAVENWADSNDPLDGHFFRSLYGLEHPNEKRHPKRRLATLVACSKMKGAPRALLRVLVTGLVGFSDDPLIRKVVWQNLHPLLGAHSDLCVKLLKERQNLDAVIAAGLLPRIVDRILNRRDPDLQSVARLLEIVKSRQSQDGTRAIVSIITQQVQTRQISGKQLEQLKELMSPGLRAMATSFGQTPDEDDRSLFQDVVLLLTSLQDEEGLKHARIMFRSDDMPPQTRLATLKALVAAGDSGVLTQVGDVIAHPQHTSVAFRADVLGALGPLNDDRVAGTVISNFALLEPELQPRAVELLTQRPLWAKALLAAVGKKDVPFNALNLNQVRRLNESGDDELKGLVKKHWGTIRSGRDPKRAQLVAEMKQFIRSHPGDAIKGIPVFKKVCGQCHKMYGEGAEVGPDITRNGRNSFDQLLSNVFDPSLVIGAAYQARTIVTTEGRSLTGLPVEESEQRVILKVQGGKLETIPRGEIEIFKVSELSMMPEQLEKQLKPDELADLFAYITLDRPPTDPNARQLPGVRVFERRDSTDPKEFTALVQQIAPGFTTDACGELGVGLVPDHFGRLAVRTHPLNQRTPCILHGEFDIPADRKSTLRVNVSHDPRGDWMLIVKANGQPQLSGRVVGKETTTDGWATHLIDLSHFAGRKVKIELLNQPTGWSWEFAYWSGVEIRSE